MHWRKSAWALVGWTAVMIPWLLAAASATAKRCSETSDLPGECGGYVLFAVVIVLSVWFLVAVPLFVVWHSAKRKLRACPACGRSVSVGRMRCRCGYSFAQ
jgi:hypothetical protein